MPDIYKHSANAGHHFASHWTPPIYEFVMPGKLVSVPDSLDLEHTPNASPGSTTEVGKLFL